MGTFRHHLEIGDPEGSRFVGVEALVDTGATYTWIPRGLLDELGVTPTERWPFVTADGRTIERDVAETRVRLNGEVRTTIVVFAEEGSETLLGAYTLEGFRLAADPINRRLISVPGLAMMTLSDDERRLLLAIQDGLPLVPEPYRVVAEGLGMPEERVLELVRSLLAERKIKRIGAVPNHYMLGITANGMAVWDVPDVRVRELGQRLGRRPEVSHCYRRPRRLPHWPYNLFAMVHGRTRQEVLAAVERIASEVGLAGYRHDTLFSTRLLKKRGTRVRGEDEQAATGSLL